MCKVISNRKNDWKSLEVYDVYPFTIITIIWKCDYPDMMTCSCYGDF